MGLSSEQARELQQRPRINPDETEQRINHAVGGKKPAEVALLFPQYAKGTTANLLSRERELIADRRRKRMVQFEDLTIVRKQARLDDLQNLRDIAWSQLEALLEEHQVIDGETGEVKQLAVDPRLFKAAADSIMKVLRTVDETTGQLPQRVDGLGEKWTPQVLGLNGKNGIDYPAIVAAVPELERKAAARKQWSDEDTIRRYMQRGMSREQAEELVQKQKDRDGGFTPLEACGSARRPSGSSTWRSSARPGSGIGLNLMSR